MLWHRLSNLRPNPFEIAATLQLLADWLQRRSGREWVSIVSRTTVRWCCQRHTLAPWLNSYLPCWLSFIHYHALARLSTNSSSISSTLSLFLSYLLLHHLRCQS